MLLRDQRRHQRYNLRLPLELVRTGTQKIDKIGETRNLSSSGVLFTADADVEIGQPIEFLITLPTGTETTPVRLKCVGKIVRKEELRPSLAAATVERFEFVRR